MTSYVGYEWEKITALYWTLCKSSFLPKNDSKSTLMTYWLGFMLMICHTYLFLHVYTCHTCTFSFYFEMDLLVFLLFGTKEGTQELKHEILSSKSNKISFSADKSKVCHIIHLFKGKFSWFDLQTEVGNVVSVQVLTTKYYE